MTKSDRDMNHLLERMHTCSGTVIMTDKALNDPDEDEPEFLELAAKLREEHSLLLAQLYNEFICEVLERRRTTGDFQYPFEPLGSGS
ncbi:hypothetical protein [Labrenzia sp. PHM005]|uniref:hypothetical protein n=1 Tax=Labrenzia sp. PHM005 TaxID=2590016 RepID=UPI001140222E|nr:hypothetical protein [Labrenzia sp. PHM005]QDG74394.1 hypothetical protein FJ695_00070 [Labrenzia sp. PHM005]